MKICHWNEIKMCSVSCKLPASTSGGFHAARQLRGWRKDAENHAKDVISLPAVFMSFIVVVKAGDDFAIKSTICLISRSFISALNRGLSWDKAFSEGRESESYAPSWPLCFAVHPINRKPCFSEPLLFYICIMCKDTELGFFCKSESIRLTSSQLSTL